MTNQDSIAAARDQLNRTLTFFPRVDSKASVVFGINAGLIAVLATRVVPVAGLGWIWVPLGVTLVLLAASFWQLYRQAFPALEGGQASALYFREIAGRTEAKYIDEWTAMTDEQYLKELLGQVWRNSEILRKKFDHLKAAFNLLALAIVPWVVSLAALTWRVTP